VAISKNEELKKKMFGFENENADYASILMNRESGLIKK
jgi:hypothetical protein